MPFSSRLLLLPCLTTLAFGQGAGSNPRAIAVRYHPITGQERLKWFGVSSFGPASLGGGVLSAGFGTLFNRPSEYGPHWEGFADRYGMRLTGVVTNNAMEAGLGALWHEDPRYPRRSGQPIKDRIGHVLQWTFLAQDSQGRSMPAYARYVANAGSNFLSNTWRERSEADTQHALERTALGFAARMSANAFKEFWPDIHKRLSRSKFPKP